MNLSVSNANHSIPPWGSTKPPYVVVDFETELAGEGSTEHWHPDFRVVSMAASWLESSGSIRSIFLLGEDVCRDFLEHVATDNLAIIAHNVQFEIGVSISRFPALAPRLNWFADTMRLVQVYDNGGDKFAMEAPLSYDDLLELATETNGDANELKPESTAGLGLAKSVRRILREPDHKRTAYLWLCEHVPECKPGREGRFLGRLPPDMLRDYNVGDTEATLRLYRTLVDYFRDIGYDWSLDHQLYFSSVRYIVGAKIRGTRVDREALTTYAQVVKDEIRSIARQFCERFAREIRVVERGRLLVQIQKRKTLRGKRGYLRRLRAGDVGCIDDTRFNVGSNKQLEALFCGVLGIKPKFQTAKGAPSFRSSVLSQWGDGGLMLQKRRKRLIVLKQAEALLELSAYDGRWHVDLKAAGTSTGRFAGGSNA
jgi:hypothetical protein